MNLELNMKIETRYLDNYLKSWFGKNVKPLVDIANIFKDILLIIKGGSYEEVTMDLIDKYLEAHRDRIDAIIPTTKEEAKEFIDKHFWNGEWNE
jgi:hypothetical protein